MTAYSDPQHFAVTTLWHVIKHGLDWIGKTWTGLIKHGVIQHGEIWIKEIKYSQHKQIHAWLPIHNSNEPMSQLFKYYFCSMMQVRQQRSRET